MEKNNIETIIKEYEGEINILINNKHNKDYVFTQYIAYQSFLRNNYIKSETFYDIQNKVLDYIKK